jgi:hypothetical protein
MSANDGLRLVCADILQVLALADMWRFASLDDRRPLGLLEGAGLLRWAERFEYGDPVPADEHQAALDELESERDDYGQLADDTEAENKRLRKRIAEFEKAAERVLRAAKQ